MRRGCLIPKQKCFQFMLETREVHVLSEVRWQTVPHTWACRTEVSIAETVVCPWDEACPDGITEIFS